MPTSIFHPDAALIEPLETIIYLLLRAETAAASLCGSATSDREQAKAFDIMRALANVLVELRLIIAGGAVSLRIDRVRVA